MLQNQTASLEIVYVSASFTRPNNATTYAVNDAMSNAITSPEILRFVDVGSGLEAPWVQLVGATITGSAKQGILPQMDLWLFQTLPSPQKDNVAFAISDAENAAVVGVLSFGADLWRYSANNCRADLSAIRIPMQLAPKDRNLYGVLVMKNAYLPAANESYTISLIIEREPGSLTQEPPEQPPEPTTASLVYSGESKVIVGVSNEKVYAAAATRLYLSTDNLQSWRQVADIAPDFFESVFMHPNTGIGIAFSAGGGIYRSADGLTFAKVNTGNLGTIATPLYHGLDWKENVFVFGEYATTSGAKRILLSQDAGMSWSSALSKNAPGEIRHWHSINYFPEAGYFIATSGDEDAQVRWWKSADGLSWEAIAGISGQIYRTLHIQSLGNGDIMWGSDTTLSPGIYKAALSDLGTVTKVFSLPNACWGLAYHAGIYVAITSVETGDSNKNAYIYTSVDGLNWQMDKAWSLQSGSSFGGFRSIRYSPNFGRWYFNITNLVDTTPAFYSLVGSSMS